MLANIQKNIIKLIGFGNYRKILTSWQRFLHGIHGKTWTSPCVTKVKEYKIKGKHCFFGYYDLQSIDETKTKLLSIVTTDNNNDDAEVGYFDIESGEFHKLSTTKAWNWQMGARLRWYDGKNLIMFNDFDGDKFISRVVDLEGKEQKRYNFPLYDLSGDMKTGYYTDFTILNLFRKGYGYGNIEAEVSSYYNTDNNGVFKADLISNTSELLISMDTIKEICPVESMENSHHYVNHISACPYSDTIMFFHLWFDEKGDLCNRMFFAKDNGEIINVISDFKRASHYCWQDESHMLVSVCTRGNLEYRLYNIFNGKYKLVNEIVTDGHPSMLEEGSFITDTYPDRSAMENVYYCNKSEFYRLFSVYHNVKMFGERRCDLHPRVKDELINVDTHIKKHRKQYLLWTALDNIKKSNSVPRINLNPRKRKYKTKNSFYYHAKNQYLLLTGRERPNSLKIWYSILFSPTFRANVWIAKMQGTKNSFAKKIIRNKLEVKYSAIVCETAKIGKEFRADHCLGLVIGPGAVIGDYCKFYQQVTVGQKNGKFPRIGNHVTVYAGAKIIGDITIGDYSVIGANAVVTKDVPAYSVVAGIPAKIIKTEEY